MTWLSRIFRRTPRMPPITEDWQVGDLAQGIPEYWAFVTGQPGIPCMGTKYQVAEVFEGRNCHSGAPGFGLRLIGVQPPHPIYGYEAIGFRKVFPDAFAEPRVTAATRPKRPKRVDA
jgi:hypothetical protein